MPQKRIGETPNEEGGQRRESHCWQNKSFPPTVTKNALEKIRRGESLVKRALKRLFKGPKKADQKKRKGGLPQLSNTSKPIKEKGWRKKNP